MSPLLFALLALLVASLASVAASMVTLWWWNRRQGVHPAAQPRPDRGTRAVETAVLALLGVVMLVAQAHRQSLPAVLDQVRPELARTYIALNAAAGATLLLSLLPALLGRTALSLAAVTATIVGYGALGSDKGLARLAPPGATEPVLIYCFGVNTQTPGARLWLNGVELGSIPLRITREELTAKVPYWAEPPAGVTPRELQFGHDSNGQRRERPWFKLMVPTSIHFTHLDDQPAYYGQVEFEGEWGWSFSGGTSGDGGIYVQYHLAHLEPEFPRRDAAIRAHLEAARKADYHIDADWIAVADRYGMRGWMLLWQSLSRDPRLREVMQAWAAERYGLARVTDSDTAHAALERVMAEADTTGSYDSRSVAGAAVEWLIPRLDPNRLAEQARATLAGGDRDYAFSYHFRGPVAGHYLAHQTATDPTGQDRNNLPLRAYVLAHAVWKMDAHLDTQDETASNVIETRVLSDLVYRYARQQTRHDLAMDAAIALGWPDAFRFLIRQDWQRPVHVWHDPLAQRLGIAHDVLVNAWYYRLLTLPGQQAQAFRQQHHSQMVSLANQYLEKAPSVHQLDHELAFLFMDPQLGEASPGMKYWPQLLSVTGDKPSCSAGTRRAKSSGDSFMVRNTDTVSPVVERAVERLNYAALIFERLAGCFAAEDARSRYPTRAGAVEDLNHVAGTLSDAARDLAQAWPPEFASVAGEAGKRIAETLERGAA